MDDMSNMDMSHMDMPGMATPTPTLTDAQMAAMTAAGAIYGVVALVLLVISLVATWKIYVKAGQAGWKALIPIYNIYILLKIVGRPGWWMLLLLIPLVNIVISLVIAIDLGKAFGKSTGYSLLMLWLLSFIGYCLLAFGKAQYLGPQGRGSTGSGGPSTSDGSPAMPSTTETPTPEPAPATDQPSASPSV
jgi:hypothetical protein